MLNQYFQHIYVINLKSRADRRREMAHELARIGLSFDDDAVTLFSAVKPAERGAFPSIGARGCFLSHLNILTDAAARNFQSIAILEDDLAFAPDFMTRVSAMLEALQQRDWSIFYGGYEQAQFNQEGLQEVPAKMALRTTHFVCFNGPAIALTKQYLEVMSARPAGDAQGGPMHVDGAYCWLRKDMPQLKTFAAAPPLGVQRSSRSDIAPLRWYDRAPGFKQAARMGRRVLKPRTRT